MRQKKNPGPLFVVAAVSTAAVAVAALAAAGAFGSSRVDAVGDAAQATAKYRNLGTAKAAGYGLLKDKKGISCIAMDAMPGMGAMGVHFANSKLVGDGAVVATRPEAVVYQPEPNGALKLAALEYVVLKSAWDKHHATAPSLFGRRFNFTPAGNRFALPAYYSLHAWLWKHNPSGQFAMWNPDIHCPA
jgi:hypothetical protein